ncbi:MAG: 7-carboxy-7-deazaguanine synthase QueE [Acidimicrobiales bacterium]
MSALSVSEVFGPTWQGEGPSSGRRAGFVRLGRCNLACRWCDTPFTWDWDRFDPAAELHAMGPAEILDRLDAMDVTMVVVSGGEPLLQQAQLAPLLEGAKARGWWVEIETAGTIRPALGVALVDRYNVSPKLANSGNPLERRYKPEVLRALRDTGRAVFKFVACEPADLDEVGAIVEACGIGAEAVWVMPEGTDEATVTRRLRQLAPAVLARGWNLTGRLHIAIWGDRRGV